MLLAKCTPQVKKESKKEILTQKEKNNKVTRNLLPGESDPQNQ